MSRTDDLLIERLREADPLPHDQLDLLLRESSVDELLSRVPPRRPERRSRRVLWGAATAAGVAAVAGVLVVSLPRGEEAGIIPGNIGILDRPATDADRLPEWVTDDMAVVEAAVDPASARLARTVNGRRYYVANGRGRGAGAVPLVCLIEAPEVEPPLPSPIAPNGSSTVRAPGGGAVLCAGASALTRRFIAAPVTSRPSIAAPVASPPSIDIVGIVPDGYERVRIQDRSVPVEGNVFVVDGAEGADPLIATGPAGERRAYAGVATSPPSSLTPPRFVPRVSVLQRPARRGDAAPPPVARAAARAARRPTGVAPVVTSARYAGEHAGRRHWVMADARRPGTLTVATLARSGSVSFRNLGLPNRRDPLGLSLQSGRTEAYGPLRVSLQVVVPDGFTTATIAGRRYPVTGNLLALHGVSSDARVTIELTGPAGALRRSMPFSVGNSEVIAIPTNRVPEGAADLIRYVGRQQGLGTLRSANVTVGTAAQVRAATGLVTPPASDGWVWVITGTDGTRTAIAAALTQTGRRQGLFLVNSTSAARPPDLSALTRVRPVSLRR